MVVKVEVYVEMSLDDCADGPDGGDPLVRAMEVSAREAVENAVRHAYENGMEYPLVGIAGIDSLDVRLGGRVT